MIRIGDRVQLLRLFTREDILAYGKVSGHHISHEFVPEPMIGAMFSYLLGMKLPGPGTNYLKQSLSFETAAKIGDLLTASVTVTKKRPEKKLIDLETICLNHEKTLICKGRALVVFDECDNVKNRNEPENSDEFRETGT